MTCNIGISAAQAGSKTATVVRSRAWNESRGQSDASAARSGASVQPGPAPEGMVCILGGEFWMGADEFPDAHPWDRVVVNGFWMDKTEVTNEQFEQFVKATDYMTVAQPRPVRRRSDPVRIHDDAAPPVSVDSVVSGAGGVP